MGQTSLLQLPSINWEVTGSTRDKPSRAVQLQINPALCWAIFWAHKSLSKLQELDPGQQGHYTVLRAPAPIGEMFRKGDNLSSRDFTPLIMVYTDSVWYVLERNKSAWNSITMCQNITNKIAKLIVALCQ